MTRDTCRGSHPSRRSFGTARRIRNIPEATWAQPLGPGRAVLTRGVSRRSGSVACIHADASPTEVLAESMLARKLTHVKRLSNSLQTRCVGLRSLMPADGPQEGVADLSAVGAYPRFHGQYFARPSGLDLARPDVRRIERTDVGVALPRQTVRPADDRAGTLRGHERVLHSG